MIGGECAVNGSCAVVHIMAWLSEHAAWGYLTYGGSCTLRKSLLSIEGIR